jgi:hypothetical protein
MASTVSIPRSIIDAVQQGELNRSDLYYAAIISMKPTTTLDELITDHGASVYSAMDVLGYFEELANENMDVPRDEVATSSKDSESGVVEPERPANEQDAFAQTANEIFTDALQRDDFTIRPHQYKELFHKVGGDLDVVKGLAQLAAKNESEGPEAKIRHLDRWVFALLSKHGPEKFRYKAPSKGKMESEVDRILSTLPPPEQMPKREDDIAGLQEAAAKIRERELA